MSNIQTGAERMPHDLSHLGFLAGQIGRLITISTTPVIAGDSFEMDAVGALRLSPFRRGLAIDSTVEIFTFYFPHFLFYFYQLIIFFLFLLSIFISFLLFISFIVTFMVNSGLSSLRMVLMPLLSRLLTLLVILTMPLFLARLTLIPIKSLSICFRVICISITTILKRRGCLTVPRLTLMSLIKMMLVMVSVAAISKTFGLLRFLLRLSFLAK